MELLQSEHNQEILNRMERIDNLDRRILEIISQNARIPFKDVAAECGVSRAAIHQRVQRLIDLGVIVGSGYHVNPKSLGYSTCTYVGVKLEKGSMYNTPPTYAIYILGLVLEWVEQQGGLQAMQERNAKKAKMLYDYLDSSSFYQTQVAKEDRSMMNVTFATPSKELDALFVKQSIEDGMSNLKGHRAVGGIRASIYNAMPLEGVEHLLAFMKRFEAENGGK